MRSNIDSGQSRWFVLDQFSGTKALEARAHRQNFPAHHHDSFQITVATKGVFKNQIGDNLYVSNNQALSITQPREVHTTVCDSIVGHWFFTLYLPEALVLQHWSGNQSINLESIITEAKLVNDFFQIRQQLLDLKQPESTNIESLIRQLLVHQRPQQKPRVDWREFINSLNLTANFPLTTKAFAEKNGINQFKFIRLFQAQVGMTPHQFLLNQKTDHAKNLIESGMALTDVALEAGFYDASHMCQVFKRFVGTTPQIYQHAIFSKT